MSLVDTRVIEGTDGKWIVQYVSGFGWNQLDDQSFDTEEEAQSYLDDQISSADHGDSGEDLVD